MVPFKGAFNSHTQRWGANDKAVSIILFYFISVCIVLCKDMVFVIKFNYCCFVPRYRVISDPSHLSVSELKWVNYFTFYFILLFHWLYFTSVATSYLLRTYSWAHLQWTAMRFNWGKNIGTNQCSMVCGQQNYFWNHHMLAWYVKHYEGRYFLRLPLVVKLTSKYGIPNKLNYYREFLLTKTHNCIV